MNKLKMSKFLKACTISVIIAFSASSLEAAEVSCRYYSDHNQQEALGVASDIVGGIADLFTGGIASSISHGATAAGIATQINNHKIYCMYTIKNKNQENNDKIFYGLLKNGELIPVFLYENLAQKKIEKCNMADINTPFSDEKQRDKTAKDNEFVFNSNTAISDIKYFGFIQPKTNNIIMYSVNPSTLKLREPTYKQWKEIYEEYLK